MTQIMLALEREEVEAIAVELGAISSSESSFEPGSPTLALYAQVLNKLRSALFIEEEK